MKRRGIIATTAVGAVAALLISACSSSGSSSSGSSNNTTPGTVAFNAGITSVVNPSTHKGGTLTYDLSNTPDSFDPGNTYYAWVLNFDRLFAMPLFTYKSCPGSCGLQLVPDLATDMGTTRDNGLTWTFHIQSDVKFENGTVVDAQDVKYAIERTYDRSVLANGPTYYQVLLTDPKYPGPYKDKSATGSTAIDTPNATTLVFHLQAPFPDLPYVLAFPSSAPVLQSADTGSNYQLHPLSTGPYMFKNYTLNKQLTLEPGHGPERQAAGQPDHREPEREPGRHRQPAAARRHPGGLGRNRTGRRRAGPGPGQPDAQGQLRQPGQRVRPVHLPQHQGRAAEQPALPSGDRVRGEQGDHADRVGRPGRGRADRQHRDAAKHRGLQVVRLLQRAVPADRRHHRGQAATPVVRPAERLQHQPGLPQR